MSEEPKKPRSVGKKAGRKPGGPDGENLVHTSISLSKAEIDTLDEHCDIQVRNRSQLMRFIIAEWIRNNEVDLLRERERRDAALLRERERQRVMDRWGLEPVNLPPRVDAASTTEPPADPE
jgi:hypothetical protein